MWGIMWEDMFINTGMDADADRFISGSLQVLSVFTQTIIYVALESILCCHEKSLTCQLKPAFEAIWLF